MQLPRNKVGSFIKRSRLEMAVFLVDVSNVSNSVEVNSSKPDLGCDQPALRSASVSQSSEFPSSSKKYKPFVLTPSLTVSLSRTLG